MLAYLNPFRLSMEMARVTLQDIASRAGVSKATVSLALRGSSEIGESTTQKVRKIADQLGYRPDPTLSKIAASRWKQPPPTDGTPLAFVASLHPDHAHLIPENALHHPMSYLTDPYCNEKWVVYLSGHTQFKGARKRATELGYSIQYYLHREGENVRALANNLYHRGVQGIVFSPIFDRDFISKFRWDQFACISLADHYYLPPTDFVVPKLSSHIHMVFSQLFRRGYTRPGIVLYHERIQHLNNHILRGVFLSLCESVGFLDQVPGPCYIDHNQLDGIKSWIESENPDVIIGFNDFVYELLLKFEYSIPRDFAFVSLARKETDLNHIAGVKDADFLMGVTGVDILDQKLRHGMKTFQSDRTFTTIQTDWCEGNSLPLKKGMSSHDLRSVEAKADFLRIFENPTAPSIHFE